MALSRAAMPHPGYQRRYRRNRRCLLDHWYLLIESAPGAAPLAPGEPLALAEPLALGERRALGERVLRFGSLATDYDEKTEASQRVVLYFSRDLCPEFAPALDRLAGPLPDCDLFGLAGDLVVMAARQIGGFNLDQRAALVQSIRAMIVAMARDAGDERHEAALWAARTLHERARRTIRQQLTSPDLTPERLCRAIGVSRSSLYRMFEYAGGVAAYIQRQKLLAAHAMLSDRSCVLPVSTIAMSLGFEDASAFSRAFKRDFAVSPREAREAAAAGVPVLADTQPIRKKGLCLETMLGELQT